MQGFWTVKDQDRIRLESNAAVLIKASNSYSTIVGLYGILTDINFLAIFFISTLSTGFVLRKTMQQKSYLNIFCHVILLIWRPLTPVSFI